MHGKANLVLTGSNAAVTPIVYEGVLGTDLNDAGTVVGDDLSEFTSVVYDATALQYKASKVSFDLKHSLGLTLQAEGVQNAANHTIAGTGK